MNNDRIIYTIVELDFNGDIVEDLEEQETYEDALNVAENYWDRNIAIYEDFVNELGCYDSNVMYTRINGVITKLREEK